MEKTKKKLEKPTTGDYILSFIIPGWGFLIGIIALFKAEFRRGGTMIAVSLAMIVLYCVLRFS